MKLVISDPFLGKRELDPTDKLAVIQDQHKLLSKFKESRALPKPELLADIAAYEYILRASDPRAMAETYFKAKDKMHMRPREVAAKLGWKV